MKATFYAMLVFFDGGVSAAESCELDGVCDDAVQLLQINSVKNAVNSEQAVWKKSASVSFDDYAKCNLLESDCSVKGMKGPTLVYPGGKTLCLDGSEYAFAVIPGDQDKLLFNFQGGGACWEADGAFGKVVVEQCTASLSEAVETSWLDIGAQDADNHMNPFKKHTWVNALYCGGGAWMSNTTMKTADGRTLYQYDYYNALAARAWAIKNFPEELKSFVFAGQSAGALGVPVWANNLLNSFASKKATVIIDSYLGAFPPELENPIVQRWGLCELPLLSGPLLRKCKNGTLKFTEIATTRMKEHRDVAFGQVQSKLDKTQIYFWVGVAHSFGLPTNRAPIEFLEESVSILATYMTQPNYVAYSLNADHHVYMDDNFLYNSSVAGAGVPAPQGQPSLVRWLDKVLKHRRTVMSRCVPDTDNRLTKNYCDAVIPKHLVLA